MEARVGRLENDMREVKDTLRRLEALVVDMRKEMATKADVAAVRDRLSETREELKEMKGALSKTPTISHLLTATISTWIAGAGIVFVLLRLTAE